MRFGLSNLRRLEKLEAVELRPLTVLVGRNSSGKSSFLRSLALIRQSLMTRISAPILWFGELVDFGSFSGAVTDNDASRSISFDFALDHVRSLRTPFQQSHPGFKDVHLTVSVSASEDNTFVSLIKLREAETQFELIMNNRGVVSSIKMNGEEVLPYFKSETLYISSGSLIPELNILSKAEGGLAAFRRPDVLLSDRIVEITRRYLDKRIRPYVVEALATDLLNRSRLTTQTFLQISNETANRSWQKLMADVASVDSHGIRAQLERVFHASRVLQLMNSTSQALKAVMNGILYIGPARARSDRYYRYQDLAVSEIDPDGRNFPMFLNSLSAREMREFSDWIKRLFGYGVRVSRSSGHISIEQVHSNYTVNLVDTGYGISQVLPVLAQLWWATNGAQYRRTLRQPRILLIEQPELHLHPAHQALLADALSGHIMAGSEGPTRLQSVIVETHSEAFINRLGALIHKKTIDPRDVQVIVFQADEIDDRRTETRIATFDSDGALVNWPYGFFQPGA